MKYQESPAALGGTNNGPSYSRKKAKTGGVNIRMAEAKAEPLEEGGKQHGHQTPRAHISKLADKKKPARGKPDLKDEASWVGWGEGESWRGDERKTPTAKCPAGEPRGEVVRRSRHHSAQCMK